MKVTRGFWTLLDSLLQKIFPTESLLFTLVFVT